MRAIVSFANERGNYIAALNRLRESVEANDKSGATFFGFVGEGSVGAPLHLDNNYAFKVYCINEVRRQGYTSVLWLDTSCVVRKDLSSIFDEIEACGYIMQEAGCYLGEWSSDRLLAYGGLTRDEAMIIPCYGNAGFLGLDFNNEEGLFFFMVWQDIMMQGLFNGAWDNNALTESQDPRCKGHRHDLSAGSMIAHQMEWTYHKGDEILQYSPPDEPLINDTILISAQGM